jgi:hypothetical protein
MKGYIKVYSLGTIEEGDILYSPEHNDFIPVPHYLIGTMVLFWPVPIWRKVSKKHTNLLNWW